MQKLIIFSYIHVAPIKTCDTPNSPVNYWLKQLNLTMEDKKLLQENCQLTD